MGSPETRIPTIVDAAGNPRMNSDPSAAWTVSCLDRWSGGVVIGSVSTKAAPSGPIATMTRRNGTVDPLTPRRAAAIAITADAAATNAIRMRDP